MMVTMETVYLMTLVLSKLWAAAVLTPPAPAFMTAPRFEVVFR